MPEAPEFPVEVPLRERLEMVLSNKSRIFWGDKLSKADWRAWLENFSESPFDREKTELLALYLLSKLVYVTESELEYLATRALQRYLRSRAAAMATALSVEERRAQILAATRFAALGRPSESGGLILYKFRQVNRLALDLFVDYNNPPEPGSFDTLCFVDDASFSGSQAMAYARQAAKLGARETVVLLTVATTKAIRRLERAGLRVYAGAEIDSDEMTLRKKSAALTDVMGDLGASCSEAEIKQFCDHFGRIASPRNPLGYGKSGLLVAFYHNVPNNTLPIFWAQRSNWKPVLARYAKTKRGIPPDARNYL